MTITLVGKRVEIAVFYDDRIEVSEFLGTEDAKDEKYLQEILRQDKEDEEKSREYFKKLTESKIAGETEQ